MDLGFINFMKCPFSSGYHGAVWFSSYTKMDRKICLVDQMTHTVPTFPTMGQNYLDDVGICPVVSYHGQTPWRISSIRVPFKALVSWINCTRIWLPLVQFDISTFQDSILFFCFQVRTFNSDLSWWQNFDAGSTSEWISIESLWKLSCSLSVGQFI